MLKVKLKNTLLKNEVNVDPYGLFLIRWEGHDNNILRYFRFGDLKNSLLEIGVDENGNIFDITLVEVKNVKIHQEKNNINFVKIFNGLPIIEYKKNISKQEQEYRYVNMLIDFLVEIYEDAISINIKDDKPNFFICSEKVLFSVNSFDELCSIIIIDLNEKEIEKFKKNIC